MIRRRLSSIDPVQKVLIAAVVVGLLMIVAAAAAWSWQGTRAEAKASAKDVDQLRKVVRTQTVYRNVLVEDQARIKELEHEIRRQQDRRARDVAAARSEAERLQHLLATRDSDAARAESAPIGADDPSTLRVVLGACSAEYQAMAGDADEVADRLRGLQLRIHQQEELIAELRRQLKELNATY